MEHGENAISSGRDPRHQFEDAIEENGDEFVAHSEYYDGADEYPTRACDGTAEQTALVLAPISKYHTMAIVPGRCCRGFLDVSSFTIAFLILIIQFGLLNYYYHLHLENRIWWGWFGGDLLVIVTWLVLLIFSFKYNQEQMEEVTSLDAKVKWAWLAWLVYAAILVGKVATCFRIFYNELPPEVQDNNDKDFDDNLFKLGLSLSVLIFIFLLEAFHYTPITSNRQLYISYLTTAICLDLIDSIYFLDLLWQAVKDGWNLEFWLDVTVLAVAMFNFLMPTCALFRLRFTRFPTGLLVSDKIWALLYVLLVNVPFLGLRIYLFILLEYEKQGRKYDPSLFAVKNIAMIYIAIRELWTRLQYWRTKHRAAASRSEVRSELVPTQPPAEDE